MLSREPVEVVHRCLPGLDCDDTQARYIEVRAAGLDGRQPLSAERQLRRRGRLRLQAALDGLPGRPRAALLEADEPCVFAGDYNVAPADEDFAPGTLPPTDALIRPETRAAFRKMLWLGLTDAIRAVQPRGKAYTFWDYQAGAWRRDLGLRIDHALLSPDLAERLVAAKPDRDERNQPQPSDHVPVLVELAA